MRPQLTKIAGLCLLLALTACSQDEKKPKRLGVGASSKVGQTLTSKTWCGGIYNDSQNRFSWDQYAFRAIEGDYIKKTFVLNTDATNTQTAEENGKWALVGESLVTMSGPKTRQFSFDSTTRNSDKAGCYNMTEHEPDADKVTMICPCQQ